MLGTFGGSCAILFARKMKLKLEVILNQKPHQRNESKEYKKLHKSEVKRRVVEEIISRAVCRLARHSFSSL